MAQYRDALPQLGGDLFVTDGGIETTLIFQDGLELPDFAAYALLDRPDGEAALQRYFRAYGAIARRFGVGLILESATWRASRDWAARLGHTPAELAKLNREEAEAYHLEQIRVFAATAADLVTAITMSYIEEAVGLVLDVGDPVELAREYAELKRRLPRLNVMGGCCSTDHRHVEQIVTACVPLLR
jgi:S-methylmethionine-dependent homocysteine/selenocysteine methylase